MALRVQLPDHPRPQHHDVTHPDCVTQESRLANDYVRTPCHAFTTSTTITTTPNFHGVLIDTAKRVQYHVPTGGDTTTTTTTTPETSFPEPETRTSTHDGDRKDQDPALPVKRHNNNGTGCYSPRSRRKCPSGGNGSTSTSCPRCGRCRCEKCRSRRDLPRSWCCGGTWECSADSTLDCLTCMCCVRGTFYHCCSDAEEDADYTENPCGCCGYPRCLARWAFIVAVALFLPCLVLYWPFRALLTLVTDCYNDCGQGGCRCDQQVPAARPLIEAENCSA